jgi:hypothetical protein
VLLETTSASGTITTILGASAAIVDWLCQRRTLAAAIAGIMWRFIRSLRFALSLIIFVVSARRAACSSAE